MSSTASARSRSVKNLTDVEWLQSLVVPMRASTEWQDALRRGDIPLVAQQLRARYRPLKKLALIPALRWSADAATDAATIEAIDELQHLAARKGRQTGELLSGMVEAWLDRQPPAGIPSLLDQLLACAILLERSTRLTDGVLVRLWRFIEQHTGQVTGAVGTHHSAVRELLITEMQLLRLVVDSPSPPKKSQVQPVVAAVREFLGTFSDPDGNPVAEMHSSLAAALACLGRLAGVFEQLDLKFVDTTDRQRLEVLIARSILLFPVDCHWVTSRTPHEALDWMKRVSSLVHDDSAEAIARQIKLWTRASLEPQTAAHKPAKKPRTRPALKRKQLVSQQSDFSKYALLHSDWRDSRDRCVARFAEPVPSLEISLLEQALIHGTWAASVTVGSQTWTEGEWTCCCWYSDTDADFCELKWEPAPGVTVYRQLLWSRLDRFLLVAEEVRAPGKNGLSIESQLPIVPGWKALADGRTREWQLHHGDAVARVFPIFSAPERVQNTDGFLACENHSILTRNSADHTGVYSAFVIDWDAERRNAPAQWGPLSIAEDGQRVPRHLASAARWRVGDQTWMVFHQPEKGDSARSALGLHTHQETVIARVKDGEYARLVEVEGPVEGT